MRSLRGTIRVGALGMLLIGEGCVSPPAQLEVSRIVTDDATQAMRPQRRADLLRAWEFGAVHGATATDAIRQLRPEFFRRQTPTGIGATPLLPVVYLDGRLLGGVDVLAGLSLVSIDEIQYLAPVAAKNVFGSYCPCDGGVILVATRR